MISKNFNFLKVLSKSKYEVKKMNIYNNFKKFAFTPLKIENKKNSKEIIDNENTPSFANRNSSSKSPEYFEKFSNERPKNKIKIFSLPRNIQDLYMKAPLDINSDITENISKKILHDIHSNFVVGNGSLIKVLQTILLFTYLKKSLYIIIDNEEDLSKYIKAAENVLKEPAFNICDEKSLSNIKGYRGAYFLNINKLKENNLINKISNHVLDRNGIFIFLDIKNWNSLDDFILKSKLNEKIQKGLISVLQKENENKYNILNKYLSKPFQNAIFTINQQKELNLSGITHYGMSVTEQGIITVSIECAKKYLRKDKNVLILCKNSKEKDKILKEIESNSSVFGNKEKELLKVYLSEELDQVIKNQDENKQKNHIKDYLNYFDVLIEAPFVSESLFNYRKYNFLKIGPQDNPEIISLIRPNDFLIIDDMRQRDVLKIKVINLLSSTFLYNDLININDLKTQNLNKNEFYEKLEKFANEFQPKHKSFDYYYDNIKNNQVLLKRIVHMFFEQNFKEFFTKEREDISLITGERGYSTVIIKPMTTLQLEERYSITRFLLRHGLCETANYDEQVFRIFNSFDFVFDVSSENLEILKKKAAEESFIVENIDERPIVFHHQFRELLKDNHKEKYEHEN